MRVFHFSVDGMTVGQLTSRIGQDSMQMIAPLRNALGSLLSSSVTLIGGLVMCLATSWKLSMLAFTSIFPVLTATAVYAEWSSKLNREIFSALGDGMANATEALSNIRTVRSFSAETLEERKYQQNTAIALSKVR
jgi:ABC-type multidrug transport system fused ATPase/permease subunit